MNVQQHMLEIRLNRLFYDKLARAMSDPMNSLDQALTHLYMVVGLLLCVSIVHLYLFLAVFPVFEFFCLLFAWIYFRYQRKGKVDPGWAKKFKPVGLFRSWVWTRLLLLLIWSAAVAALWKGQISAGMTAKFFVPAILLLDVGLDWCINRGFYFGTYVEDFPSK